VDAWPLYCHGELTLQLVLNECSKKSRSYLRFSIARSSYEPKVTSRGNMKNKTFSTNHVTELLYQALEMEKGGVQIYTTAGCGQ